MAEAPDRLGQWGREQFSVLKAFGGPLGLVESVLPYLVFSLVFSVQRDLRTAIYAAVVPVVALATWRLLRRESLTQALSGVLGVALGAWAASSTGQASDFYLPNIVKNVAFGAAYAVSALARWPLLGLVIGSLKAAASAREPQESDPSPWRALTQWRQDAGALAAYQRATWVWVAMFAVRVAVQVPLYLADQVALLGLLNGLVLGAPLFVLCLYLSWLILRDVLRGERQDDPTSGQAHERGPDEAPTQQGAPTG